MSPRISMALLRGKGLCVSNFSRESFEERGLLLPNDSRKVESFELVDAIAVDLLCGFEELEARPRWNAVSIVRHILGSAFEQHQDSRGFFIFPRGQTKPETYEELVMSLGFWLPRTPVYPSVEVAEFERFKETLAELDDEKRRLLFGLPQKK